MKISEAFKVFQMNILRQAGVMVTPDQLGLKSDPIADLQAKSSQNAFSQFLTQGLQGTNLGEIPSPPTPPADPNDTAAQQQYHQDLLAYNRNFQLYNQQFMQLMLQRMAQMQQSMMAAQQQQQKSSTTASSSLDSGVLGVGGILGGVSDV